MTMTDKVPGNLAVLPFFNSFIKKEITNFTFTFAYVFYCFMRRAVLDISWEKTVNFPSHISKLGTQKNPYWSTNIWYWYSILVISRWKVLGTVSNLNSRYRPSLICTHYHLQLVWIFSVGLMVFYYFSFETATKTDWHIKWTVPSMPSQIEKKLTQKQPLTCSEREVMLSTIYQSVAPRFL